MKITFNIKGLRELDRKLGDLPRAVAKHALRKAWIEASQPLLDDIIAHTPVDTGDLKDSITIDRMGDEARTETKMQIGVFGEFYGHFQEFGTSRQPARPFVRPAIDRHSMQLLVMFRRILGKNIELAAAGKLSAPRTIADTVVFGRAFETQVRPSWWSKPPSPEQLKAELASRQTSTGPRESASSESGAAQSGSSAGFSRSMGAKPSGK